jgi:hypothetical protein
VYAGFSPVALNTFSFLLYCLCNPFAHEQSNTVCRFRDKSFSRVKAVTCQPFTVPADTSGLSVPTSRLAWLSRIHGSDGAFRRSRFPEKPQGVQPKGSRHSSNDRFPIAEIMKESRTSPVFNISTNASFALLVVILPRRTF